MQTKLPTLKDIKELKGKTVLVRASFNVPVRDGVVQNAFRITRALPTVNFLRSSGARVILIAHIGREPDETLKPVYDVLQKHIPTVWCPQVTGELAKEAVKNLSEGEVLLLENLRQHEGETENDPAFAKALAGYADIYVNDAFAASHRAHASLVGVPALLPSYLGFNFMHEYDELSKAIEPQSPSVFILGGAKFATKLPLIEEYVDTYDTVCVCGALAHDFYKARGYEIGQSLASGVSLKSKKITDAKNILLPVDVVVRGADGEVHTTTPDRVKKTETILDAGPETIALFGEKVRAAKSILWNGPLGDYEQDFTAGTEGLAKEVAEAQGYAVVGGGDTVAAIEHFDVSEKFGFMSTAGGAMLTFLETKTLPAIDVVLQR